MASSRRELFRLPICRPIRFEVLTFSTLAPEQLPLPASLAFSGLYQRFGMACAEVWPISVSALRLETIEERMFLEPIAIFLSNSSESASKTYFSWHKPDSVGGPPGKYLVDQAGHAVWFVDPGINGTIIERPDGSKVRKFDAPKATLVSYIIKGVLDRKLPWALVLLGVMTSITLEMCGIPSLAFAVGVYLPLSTSSPIFIGGLIRWLVDAFRRRRLRNLNPQTLPAH